MTGKSVAIVGGRVVPVTGDAALIPAATVPAATVPAATVPAATAEALPAEYRARE